MAMPLLTTKLYLPPFRPDLVSRPRWIERLNAGVNCKLMLISALAGFDKMTLPGNGDREGEAPTVPRRKRETTRP